ncbi:hypothetical protein DPMN_046558 [Dreissena polymorpha]|uniref:Uncharacterized protein n=1 Tax=Dreissena polymorpha TaxID=45954 RepID=A0A9D4I0P8_DREPO|nr:hypothetical protein DPMN_046558 [Dreissena polymorpha]
MCLRTYECSRAVQRNVYGLRHRDMGLGYCTAKRVQNGRPYGRTDGRKEERTPKPYSSAYGGG